MPTFSLTWKILAVGFVILAGIGYVVYGRTTAPAITSFDECAAAGYPIMESYPAQCAANGQTFVQNVTTTTGTTKGLSSESGNVRVFAPTHGGAIGLPLMIAGEARVFENTVEWRLRDADGSELAKGFTTALAGDVGQFGTFTVRSSYPQPRGAQGTLEVFSTSARDGEEIDKVTLPVTFPSGPSLAVQAFFSSTKRDPQTLQCATTYPVTRRVSKTEAPARAALEELLAGPTPMESNQGFLSNIPSGVRILSLAIDKGVARVDLSDELRSAASGSCRVGAIRSQIENTLKQFPTVQHVEILIGGKADVLEP